MKEDLRHYWEEASSRIDWSTPYERVCSFDSKDMRSTWFEGGKLNIAYNCLDRHLKECAEKVALIWQGDEEDIVKSYSYQRLHEEVLRASRMLKFHGVKKGDRVVIYAPMVPEAVISMLACQRIGAIHCVVFAGFSAQALLGRIKDASAKIVITADEGQRGGKILPLKGIVDEALYMLQKEHSVIVEKVIVIARTGAHIPIMPERDFFWYQGFPGEDGDDPLEHMDSEDPSFILYTSGTTGSSKGLLHTTGGYLVGVVDTFIQVFAPQKNDVYFCSADIGWITGHSYGVYAPLACGMTIVLFEGTPHYPEYDRFYKIIDKFNVSIFYTAPTVVRSLQRFSDSFLPNYSLKSLRILGSVGESINEDAFRWYQNRIGSGHCFIMDTWWQTETGMFMVSPQGRILTSPLDQKKGCVMQPLLGVDVAILTDEGEPVQGEDHGHLVIQSPWPAMARTVYTDHGRYRDAYFSKFLNVENSGFGGPVFVTGDGAYYDKDKDIWVTGRLDDEVNVSGHRLSTSEVEGAIASNHFVGETAVVGIPHDIKGQVLVAFVVLKNEGDETVDIITQEVMKTVVQKIGSIAKPQSVFLVKGLPKTRSGKIMRRLLKKIVTGEEDLGNTSTLSDESIVQSIQKAVSLQPICYTQLV